MFSGVLFFLVFLGVCVLKFLFAYTNKLCFLDALIPNMLKIGVKVLSTCP